MISKGKRRYLVSLYWAPLSQYIQVICGKHRGHVPRIEFAGQTISTDFYHGRPTEDIVKQVATKGYYEGCKRLVNEVDLEVFYSITKAGPHNFTFDRRGKERDEFQALEQTAFEVPVLR